MEVNNPTGSMFKVNSSSDKMFEDVVNDPFYSDYFACMVRLDDDGTIYKWNDRDKVDIRPLTKLQLNHPALLPTIFMEWNLYTN